MANFKGNHDFAELIVKALNQSDRDKKRIDELEQALTAKIDLHMEMTKILEENKHLQASEGLYKIAIEALKLKKAFEEGKK